MNTVTPMMDRRLKERLVGAGILVALIVIVVPELLSGPKRPSVPPLAAGLPTTTTRSVWVDLATSKAVPQPDVASAAPDASSPEPRTTAPQAPPSVSPSTAASAAPADSGAETSSAAPEPSPPSPVATLKAQISPPATLETPPAPPRSAGTSRAPEASASPRHAWAVQLGSFASKANADRLVRQLQAAGGSFYVVSGGSGRSLRYRVRMGPLADRSAAERAAGKLKAHGHPATVVTPAS